jgi:hypothetical protein
MCKPDLDIANARREAHDRMRCRDSLRPLIAVSRMAQRMKPEKRIKEL